MTKLLHRFGIQRISGSHDSYRLPVTAVVPSLFIYLLEEGLHEFHGMTTAQPSTSSAYDSYIFKH